MSRMKDLVLEIQDRLSLGIDPRQIAQDLKVPVYWVTESEMDSEYSYVPVDTEKGE